MARITKCGSKAELGLPGLNLVAVTGVDCTPPCNITVHVTNLGDCPIAVKGYQKGRAGPGGYGSSFASAERKSCLARKTKRKPEVAVPLGELDVATIICEGDREDGRCRFEYAFSLEGSFRGECGGQEQHSAEADPVQIRFKKKMTLTVKITAAGTSSRQGSASMKPVPMGLWRFPGSGKRSNRKPKPKSTAKPTWSP